MGYLFTDLSGWYLQQFGSSNLDFYKKKSTESAYTTYDYNTSSAPSTIPVDVNGTDYIYNTEFIIYPTPDSIEGYNTPSALMERFPYGEWRLQVLFKGRYMAFRGKFYYTSYTQSSGIFTQTWFWLIYSKISVSKDDTDILYTYDWDYLKNNYVSLGCYSFFYDRNSTKDTTDTPHMTIHEIDFSQFFETPTGSIVAKSVYGCVTPPRMHYTIYDGDRGVEAYVERWRPVYRFGLVVFGTRNLWNYNDPDPEPFIYDTKGRYKGLPTSTIPLKQTIPSGIDYRHNIVVYDETEQNARNMFLTNRVGTIPYTLIDYSVPNGTLRVATDLQFTHFVGCSFTSDNDPRIYRVVSYRVLGDNLLEYSFEMDGLKDYFQHFGITSANNFLVNRCTVSTNWNKFLQDTAFYDGTFTDYVVTGSTIYNYYALNIPNGVYVVNETGFRYFCRWITEHQAQYSQAIVGQVSSVHIVPFTDDNNIYTDVGTSLTFSLADGTPITCEFPTTVYNYNVSVNVGRYNDYVQGTLPQCAEIETFRELYDSNATIHIPCYGDFTPTLDLLSRLAVGSVPFRYYIAPIDGTCAVSFYPYTEVLPVVPLPSRTLPVNNSVSAMYTVNRESALAQGMNINRGYTAMLNSALSMDVGGFLSKPVEMKVNAIEIQQTAKNSLQAIKETQSVTNVSGSGGGAIVCRVAYLSLQVPNLSIPFDDLFSSIGYPTSKLWTTIGGVSGARYYVNLLGKVKGSKWYADLVSSDINSDYIVYNY